MSLFNFEPSGSIPKGEKKSLKFFLGIGALVGTIALGSTFAASINLNDSGPVEFGQGVAQATACDGDVTVTPFSTFVNDLEDSDFVFTSFSVTGISEACDGKIFTIKAYHDGDDSPLDLYITGGTATYNSINVLDDNGNFSFVDGGLLSDDIEDVSTGFKVTMVTGGPPPSVPLASAQDVDRITIESSASVEGTPTSYEVGETGPGGGIIFYYSEEGFNCGEDFSSTGSPTDGKCNYLEAAPNTWNGGTSDPVVVFCNVNSVIMVIDDLGAGFRNSIAMLSACSSGAATLVAAYSGGGKSDWFVGSRSEMAQLHAAKNVVGGWQVGGDVAYWMSAQNSGDRALVFRFSESVFDGLIENKSASRYVRPIRAF